MSTSKINLIKKLRVKVLKNSLNATNITLSSFKKTYLQKFVLLLFLVKLFFPQNVFAWAGYEESTNIAIDIPPGNLVRVGREVNIFDFNTNSYHLAEVIFLDDIFSGTRLEVKDLETNQRRIFYMER